MIGIQNVRRQFVLVCRHQKNVNKIMPGFEQNEGTNLKLNSASRLEVERSEILNSGSTQHLKTLFNESLFSVASNRCYTAFCHFFLGNYDINFKLKSARRFKTERCESLKSVSKRRVIKMYSESFSSVAFKRCYVASSDLDFELNRSSDSFPKRP